MKWDEVRLVGLSTVTLKRSGASMSDRYLFKAASGLGPPEMFVSISDIAVQGGVFQNRRPANRQMVYRIGLNPNHMIDETAEDLRTELYGLLTPGIVSYGEDKVLVHFYYNGEYVAEANGWISKMEPVLFTKVPEVQITIDCADPYIQAPEPYYLPQPIDGLNPIIPNIGTAPTGFKLEILFTQGTPFFRLFDGPNPEDIVIDLTLGSPYFNIGDTLTINTEPGEREILHDNGSTVKPLIYLLPSSVKWPMLRGGDNPFWTYLYTTFVFTNISYKPKYWGV